MAGLLHIDKFLAQAAVFPVIDVRSPSEFRQGHIPGAVNIPLFDDEERRIVGTRYKQVNKEAAVYAGLEFAGKKLAALAKEGERIAGQKKTLLVHCWRGGMRSKSMAWLFETLGLQCLLLEGGYKAYRNRVRQILGRSYKLRVIGGCTGSGKTDILKYMAATGKQVVDLEGLAHHKGSAFGSLGESEQPSTEHFENELSQALSLLDPLRDTWLEDESRNIGRCVIPAEFYEQMKASDLIFLDIPREVRARYLVQQYALYQKDELKSCVLKIGKKLGGQRTAEASEAIDRGDFYKTAMLTLHYYDKAYRFSLEKNHAQYQILDSSVVNAEKNTALLLAHEKESGY